MATSLPNPRDAAPTEPLYRHPPAAQEVSYADPSYQQPIVQPPPVVYQQPPQPVPVVVTHPKKQSQPELTLISHSTLFYWWPLWAVGYTLAILSYLHGDLIPIAGTSIKVYPSNNLGVFFVLTLFLVILVSNVTVRGLASAVVILSLITATVVLAYFGWWDPVLRFLGELNIYLNQGAYFWIATLMFAIWFFTVFVFDRMAFWRIRPGQITEDYVFGASARSYDTQNMTFEKRRSDFFRHYLLGLGSGDLIIKAFSGGHPEELQIPNVLFIGSKIRMIQQMISERPAEFQQPVNQG